MNVEKNKTGGVCTMHIKKIFSCFCHGRWEAAQVPGVREGLQPELQPDHTQQETHGLQAVRLRPVREGLPEESGPEETQGDAARTQINNMAGGRHLVWRPALFMQPLCVDRNVNR